MADEFLVWGSGGHGKVVADLIRCLGGRVVGFIDRAPERAGRIVDRQGAAVLYDEKSYLGERSAHGREASPIVALGVGDNAARLRMIEVLGSSLAPPLIHPSATLAALTSVGPGTVVFAGAVINADSTIGRGVILNTGAIVEHDCVLGDGVHLSPGAVVTGGVQVESGAWLGAASVVLPGIRIGARVTVGAGAVVTHDIPGGVTVVGNPARLLQPDS